MKNLVVINPKEHPHDENTIQQLVTCAEAGDSPHAVLCADGHLGYSAPIGSAIAYKDFISPSGVGYDIACGNKAVATSLFYGDIKNDLSRIMDEVWRRVAFGVGQKNDERVDHEVLDAIAHSDFKPVRKLASTAAQQLGTVGAGNHYVDLFREEKTDRIWIGVHFGSRGLGHKIATGFLSMAQNGSFDGKAVEGEMMSPPTLIPLGTPTAWLYIENMNLAGEYAYAGRDAVCNKVLEILGNPDVFDEVHNHHNFAWEETHGDECENCEGTGIYREREGVKQECLLCAGTGKYGGEKLWVVRKGSTPLFPGQRGFVGATMGEPAVILEGIQDEDGVSALYSAPHGAGRAMSRTEAAGRSKKRWTCSNRDCDWRQPPHTHKPEDGKCPECGHNKLTKRWVQEREGKINYAEVKHELSQKGIELRGGAADEAPLAYKRLPEVLAAHSTHAKVTNTLIPIGVAMAGSDTFDPYKD